MINLKSYKISVKLLSFVLAIFMFFSGLPFASGAMDVAAAEETIVNATITVVDTIGVPIKNAKVFVYSDVDKNDEIISKKTDETGILELELEEMDVYYYTISADDMISKEGTFTKTDAKADVEMTYFAKCKSCNGIGEIECTTCKGTGELIETISCSSCINGKVTAVCPECNGVDSDNCKTCEGKGIIEDECIDCSGTGKIESKIECPDCNGNKTIICNECNGTKAVEAYTDFDFKFETNPSIKYQSVNNENPVTVANSKGSITYSSSDESIVTVDGNGNLTAKGKAGETAIITAHIGYDKEGGYAPKTTTCTVTITKKNDFINEFDVANNLVYNGLAQNLITPKSDADIDTETLDIVIHDNQGNQINEAKNAGIYTVTVSDNNHEEETVTVEIAKATVTIVPDNQTKVIGETLDSHPLTYIVEGEQNSEKVILTGALSYENADKEENVDDKFLITQGTINFTSDDVNKNYSLAFDSSRELSIIDFETTAVAAVKDIEKANYGYWFNLKYISENSAVTIEAPEGYLVSTKPNRLIGSDWKDSITISEDGKYDNYRYYLKEKATGKIAGTKAGLTVSFGIDTVCPKADYVKFDVENDNFLASIGRTLTFGTFFNKKIVAEITSSDELSKVDNVELVLDDGINKYPFTNEEGKFIISNSADSIKGQAFVTVTDKAGNKNFNNNGSELVVRDENKSNILNNDCFIMIENEAPSIGDISIKPIDLSRPTEYTINGKNVYSGDVEFSFTVSDIDSGLYYSEIKLVNETGETVKDFSVGPYTETKNNDSYIVSTQDVIANNDGSYILMVTVADAAGNISKASKTIYVDRHAPIVKSFDIVGKTGTSDDSNIPHSVTMTEYGFYFKNEANVTVTFVDCIESNELLSGLSTAKIYLKDINNTIYQVRKDGTITDHDENGNKITDINQIKEITIDSEIDGNGNSVGTVTFTVDKNFKGQIYAMSIDNAGNTLVNVKNGSTPTNATEIIGEDISFDDNGYQKPNGSIIENETKHKESYSIEINAPETSKTDYNGTPLYSDAKNEGINVELVVEDTYSGIKSIQVDVDAPYNTDENYNHIVMVGDNAKAENALTYNEDNGRELDWAIVSTEENIATKMSNTINITNDSNDIVITVTLTDRAGNVSVKDYTFSLDKSAPEIEVTYNNNVKNTINGKDYYQNERVATVTIRERNLVNPSQIVVTATRDGEDIAPSQYELEELIKHTYDTKNVKKYHKTKGEDGKQTEYYEFVFELPGTVQGDYSITVASTDNAGNKDTYNRTDVFSVDTVTPYITVVFDNEDTKNGNYYSSDRKATITVTDRYFNPDTTSVVVNAADNGNAFENKDVPVHSNWSKQNEKYEQTCEVTFSKDGTYSFTVDSIDLSGKAATQYKVSDFVVDKTSPTIKITINEKEIENGSKEGYIGDVVPQVVIEDTNFNQTETKVTLTPVVVKEGTNLGYDSKIISKNADFENGMIYDYNNFKGENGNQRIYDNIYVLEASTIDKAGNTTDSKKVIFSVNRYGSTYSYKLNQYYIEKPVIQIEEINVNPLDFDNEETYITVTNTSGMTKTLSSKDINIQTQEATEKNWYSYLYAIPSDTFETDDVYSVKLSSMDSKGRVSTNINDANKQEISFTVDTTNPYFEVNNYIESENINASSKDLLIDIMDDTSGVASYEITFDGKPVETYETKVYENKTTYSLKVDGATSLSDASGRRLEVKITDAAGRSNVSENDKNTFNVRISSSFFVNMLAELQDFYHMTVAFWCTVAGVFVVIGIIIWIVLAKKKKNKNDEEKA